MLKTALMGPIMTRGLGVVQQCLACERAKASNSEVKCRGFGPGCLFSHAQGRDLKAEITERNVRLSFG